MSCRLKNSNPQRKRAGFTLIETIAAIVVLSIGIPPILYAVRQAHVNRVNPVLASKARWLAVEKLEEIIADRHAPGRGYDYLDVSNYASEVPVTDFEQFYRSVSFKETEADLTTAGTGTMTVTVEVSWIDLTSNKRQLTVSTVLTEYGGS